ncbi:MAG: hypothetical protein LBT97_12190 [Planctomycetota bacterium]|nr:hypothetical protein [Planctomycetota bacterium]
MAYDMDRDFEWFIAHQDELVKRYNGKTLAIREGKVLGAFDNAVAAVNGVDLDMGEYLVQLCIPGADAYTVDIYTPGLVMQ